MSSQLPLTGSRADWLSDRVLRGLLGTVMRLHYEARVRTMGRIMAKGIGPVSGFRNRAETHLAMIYPDQSAQERRALATTVCDNFGRTLIENYSWREFGARLAGTSAQGEGLDAVEDARVQNRPVIFVTGHIGNHEAPRHVLTQTGLTIGGLYRPMSNPYFNTHYAKTMSSWGGPVFAQGRRGTAGFAKHLKSGGMATLLFDVSSTGGINIPFMGKPARTATSAADLAIRMDAVVIPYFGIRRTNGYDFDVHVEAPIPHDTPEIMMTEMTKRLESHVRATPAQWFWVHRRWKQPANFS